MLTPLLTPEKGLPMSFLSENVILTGLGDCIELDPEQWCGLTQIGGALPENGVHDWREAVFQSVGGKLPIKLSAPEAAEFSANLQISFDQIPEIGRVIDVSRHAVPGPHSETYVITSKQGWLAVDDVFLPFLGVDKQIISKVIELCRKGPVKVEFALAAQGPRPHLTVVK